MDERKYRDLSVHEMKNMVSAISGYAELIARGIVKDAKAMEMAGKIHSQGKMFSDFLDKKYILELLLGDLYQPEWSASDLCALLEETLSEKKFVRDKLSIETAADAVVMGDCYLLKEMIGHLVDNAVKYHCGNSQVEICICRDGEEVLLEVKNEAELLTEEDIKCLSEPYYRKDKTKSRNMGGQGLGLAIVSRIVKLHKGRIEFASKAGEFCVRVFLKKNLN